MRRARNVLLAAILTIGVAGLVPTTGTARAAAAPVHVVSVEGADAVTWPAFAQDVRRYAVRPAVDGPVSLTVRASTSDPEGTVRVDGRLVEGGVTTVTGVDVGEEISVIVHDGAGTTAYSYIALPWQFPVLRRTTPVSPSTTDGSVLLTLGRWVSPSPFFETAVDDNGVPVYVRQTFNSMDLRPQPGGHYSVARGGANGADIVELDERFEEVRRLRTVDLVHTDGHDALLQPDGSAYLMAYEPNADTGLVDAVIQHITASGTVLFEWNSADHVDVAAETVVGANPDYAHVNSFEVVGNDLLVSFRHLSSVFKIARTAHDGFAEGEVVWRLGGRASDFTFTDTAGKPDGGPCAQHTAAQLDDGNIMVFDNGAWNIEPLCIDPADPSRPPVPRIPTRIAEWSLDESTMTATMVKDVKVGNEDGDRYAIFAGSTQPLDGGNVLVGWASATQAVASELSPAGDVLWEIEAPENPKYFTYRAWRTEVPDAFGPEVSFGTVDAPTVLAVGDTELPGLTCTDRGGSNLRSCDVTGLDTSGPGSGTATIVATDGAGNRTTAQRAWVVPSATSTPTPSTPAATPTTAPTSAAPTPVAPVVEHRPDVHVKVARGSWRGIGAYDVRRGQVVRDTTTSARSTYRVRLRNDGTVADRFTVRVRTDAQVTVPRWVGERRRSALLAPGESLTFSVVLSRGGRARAQATIITRSAADPAVRDRVWARTRWR